MYQRPDSEFQNLITGSFKLKTSPTAGDVLTSDSSGVATWQAPAFNGIDIGDSIGSGTAGRVLFEGAGPVLADDAGLTFNDATNALSTGSLTLTTALTAPNGGTGQSSYTVGDILYASTTSALSKLAAPVSGAVLYGQGAGVAPVWSTLRWPNSVAFGDILFGGPANVMSFVAIGTANTLLRSNGTLPVWSTVTWPDAATTGDIIYASGTDAFGTLSDVAVGQVLVSGGTGTAPAYSATPTVTSITSGTYLPTATASLLMRTGFNFITGDTDKETASISSNNGTTKFFQLTESKTRASQSYNVYLGSSTTPFSNVFWFGASGDASVPHIGFESGSLQANNGQGHVRFQAGTSGGSASAGVFFQSDTTDHTQAAFTFTAASGYATTDPVVRIQDNIAGALFTVDYTGNGVLAGTLNVTSTVTGGNLASAGQIYFNSSTILTAPSNGNLKISNYAETDFGLLQFGGTSSSFPALKRSSATLQVRLADDSGYADLTLRSAVLTGSFTRSYTAQSGTYAILTTDGIIDCTSGTFTATLPTAVGVTGKEYIVKNSGAGIITLATTSSQTIDGITTQAIAAAGSITVVSTGANWIIV